MTKEHLQGCVQEASLVRKCPFADGHNLLPHISRFYLRNIKVLQASALKTDLHNQTISQVGFLCQHVHYRRICCLRPVPSPIEVSLARNRAHGAILFCPMLYHRMTQQDLPCVCKYQWTSLQVSSLLTTSQPPRLPPATAGNTTNLPSLNAAIIAFPVISVVRRPRVPCGTEIMVQWLWAILQFAVSIIIQTSHSIAA